MSQTMYGNSLTKITDDSRISIDPREYERIHQDKMYYSNHFPDVQYISSLKKAVTRPFYSLNMTKTAARRIASICFNEECDVNIGSLSVSQDENVKGNSNTNSDKVQDFVKQVLENNDFKNKYETELEKGIALGDFAMRPYVDSTDHDKIKIAWVRADQFYPLRSNTNGISEACIASVTAESNANHSTTYYTLLEFHRWKKDSNGDHYVIDNELYRSDTPDVVGNQVPLSEYYSDIEPEVVIDGLSHPLFAYFKTPGANNKSLESPLGAGLVDNSKEVLDAINITHDQFVREVKMGKRRVIVPEQMVTFDDKVHKPIFDTHEDTFLSANNESDDFKPQDITSDIRTQEYKDALDRFIKEFEVQIGLSTGTFSQADSRGDVTATQVVSDNSMTYQTRSSYLTMVEQSIKELVYAVVEIGSTGELYTNGQAPLASSVVDMDDLDINVQFDDGVFVDKKSQADYMTELLTAGLVPKWYAIMKVNDLPESEAKKWAEEINDETASSTPETPFGSEETTGGDDE
ncbi:phage portal protein [Pediococcus ethanolidurans]|uniref:phage portal protein n=1 Tax=Pediococcus ethanolidurans TaxID=319653 RepID=UPI0021E78D7D|nr:phage portal protein [Pediococcus ethanolidurans]MCV3315660.1 phage portal protein [Pediococcus ethanolidurans]